MTCYATEGNAATVSTTGTILFDQSTTSDTSAASSYLKIVAMNVGDTCTYNAGDEVNMEINYIEVKAKAVEFIKSDTNSSWSPSSQPASSSKNVFIDNKSGNCYFFASTFRSRGTSGSSSSLVGYTETAHTSTQSYGNSANYIVVPEKDYSEAGLKLSSWSNDYGTQIYGYFFRLVK